MDMSRSDTMLRTHHRVCLELQRNFKGFELDLSRRTFKGTKTAFLLLMYIYIYKGKEDSERHMVWSSQVTFHYLGHAAT